jgi:hypothetical protein
MSVKTKINETRCVTVLSKRQRTDTLANIWAVESGSNKKYSVKFQGRVDVECLMNEIQVGTMLIVRGFMGEWRGEPEFNVYSFEVSNRSKKTYFPSEDVEYINFKLKKKESN